MSTKASANRKTANATAINAVCVDAGKADSQALFALLEEQEKVIGKKSEIIESQKKRIVVLEEYLRLERARRFGPSSEKHPSSRNHV